MKKLYLLCLSLVVTLGAVAEISVCGMGYDENGHFDCPFIKSGSITWDESSRTLTLDNAVLEHISENPYDYVYPVRVTEDATIVIHGECKLNTNGFVALSLEGYNSKNVTIQGDGSLYVASRMRGIFLVCTRLTIKDIHLQTPNGIMNNGDGVLCKLDFDNVKADIKGGVDRIGEGITFTNCSITYPADAYTDHSDYGYYIAYGNGNAADHIIISRNAEMIKGDVNGDGEVNIADINAVIAVILGGGGGNTSGDVNADGEINIADVNAIINIILNPVVFEDHEWVDLGLPSGTLWATMNVGAKTPEEYGDYFAWGETAPMDYYGWSTYKWCNGSEATMTKYCTNSSYGYNGFVDNKTELEPEDDAAYVNWGPSWRMPSKEQQDELRMNCTWTWTTQNGVNGQLVTGPNGNTLFFPAAGFRVTESLNYAGTYGLCWSRTLGDGISGAAYDLNYDLVRVYYSSDYRYYGFTVRAVRVAQN